MEPRGTVEGNKLENYFNSRTYTQIHSPSMVQGEVCVCVCVWRGVGCGWWNKIKGFLPKAKSFRNTATYQKSGREGLRP